MAVNCHPDGRVCGGRTDSGRDEWAIGARGAVLSGSPKLTAWSAGPWEMYDLSSDPAE